MNGDDVYQVAGTVLFVFGLAGAWMIGAWGPLVENRLPRSLHMLSCCLMGMRGFDVGRGNVAIDWLGELTWSFFAGMTAWMALEVWRARRRRRPRPS